MRSLLDNPKEIINEDKFGLKPCVVNLEKSIIVIQQFRSISGFEFQYISKKN
jgi:hypothetical protein